MRKFPPFVLFLLLVTTHLYAQKKTVTQPTTPGVSAATVERVVRALAADEMEGRASGKPGSVKAADFLAAEFQRIGLQPLPGLTNFNQTFPAYEARTAAAFVSLNGSNLMPGKFVLISGQSHLNWTESDEPGTHVVTIGPKDNLMKEVRPLLDPKENTIVFIDPAQEASFSRIVGFVKRGGLRAEKPAPFTTLLVLGTPPATPLRFQVAATTSIRTVELRNVVGMLPGQDAERAKEHVIFSGHYDHLGMLPAVAGDSIANGADDDASGTTAVVALAEYFKKQNDNARPLIFVAFAAEEIGGYGARHFSRQLDAKQVVAMFNIEMIGKQAKFGPNTAFITGFDKSDFGTLLQANAKGTIFHFEADPYPDQNLFYRSDNATLARLGVPAHTISTDQIPTDKRYHSVDDEVESLDLANMTAVITAIGRSAAGIISGQQTPVRIAPETVRQ
ncbi:M20/M25/M40 family metallo-hydrolase [Hymenobacter rubripertinctus]|uniref:M20/M25/M40 family metallo-hydrolase n=1 Tax=Hymenobacter rubripertinctus TaxID=2029981 RepID=A0A418QMS9_9BACT|nr:M20/M25/M40 family metallo-hydrolase [Hymenobacter rubripertinctus]RIY06547.1 M20/M25/M40 family metallo-hydrolase [Hymenobacter rubripertinctus]